MPKIIQLSPHIANLIAAGEVVERPSSVVKELLENAVDAGASKITVEIRDGGMTFLRVTDNGCGMSSEDARTAFLRHATSKLRTADDLAAIGTMGFRGEALAAIASVSRIDLLTKTPESLTGTSLSLEAGVITEEQEAGCPDGTTIIIRDLFFNTPARMKFMKSDTVEGTRVAGAVQMQALAHPDCAITLIRDGKQVLSTSGSGGLQAAVYCVYGRECANMIPVDSHWDKYTLTGFVTKPTDARPSRNLQTFFVNHRPVKSRLLISALEEAYRNQIMVGKFPSCVLHLELPPAAVDVNVHPAKTEVKFLNEKAVFDCVHYGVLGALNKTTDRPQVQFRNSPVHQSDSAAAPAIASLPDMPQRKETAVASKKQDFFRTMNAEEYKAFSAALQNAPQPKPQSASAAAALIHSQSDLPLRESVAIPRPAASYSGSGAEKSTVVPSGSANTVKAEAPYIPQQSIPLPEAPISQETQTEQTALDMPKEIPWRMVGELYNCYILVEQGEDTFLIDKHAAHERILFEKLKANQEDITAQLLLTPISVRLAPSAAAELLGNLEMLESLGFTIEEFGDNTLLLRQIPMDLNPEDAAQTIESLASDLQAGKTARKETVRDELLHTIACKAAIKAGWVSDSRELMAIAQAVMSNDELKYCPHGRPICITLSKKTLEKQFKRS